MSVKLRKKNTSKGESLYLDIYHQGTRSYEFLEIYLVEKEVHNNKEKMRLAEAIRSQKEIDLKNQQYGFLTSRKASTDFFTVFRMFIDSYDKTDHARYTGCLKHLKSFYKKDKLMCNQVTTEQLARFLEHLKDTLAPDTASNYFKLLRRVIRYAIKNGFMLKDPAEGIVNRNKDAGKLKKDYLLPEEFAQLIAVPCSREEVRRAFILSFYTGLRGTDCRTLKWKEVKLSEGIIDLDQNKTGHRVVIPLNDSAIKILGTPGKREEFVFKLPEKSRLAKIMKQWTKDAGIEKHITFHCGRHSFASELIRQGTDPVTVKELMGLTSMKVLEKYMHSSHKTKGEAIRKLKAFV